MNSVYSDRRKRVIRDREYVEFSSFSSFHLIVITARVKGEKQLSATDDEDLTIEIDGGTFPKLGSKNALVDSPASFSGGGLHDLSQTIYFLIFLKGKEHKIILKAEGPPGTAMLESLEVCPVNLDSKFDLTPQIQAEDGDRRPWLTFALVDLPIKQISAALTLRRRFIDSDDVKIVVDGQVKRNTRSLFRRFWYLAASLLFGENQNVNFVTDLSSGLHYIEFWSDRMPVLHDFVITFGKVVSIPSDVPTLENPKWTGDFYDDTETLLLARAIYGEAGGESYEVKNAVGWAIRNRVADKANRWGCSYHDVILARFQYEPFNNPESGVFKRITDPILSNSLEYKAWRESCQVAGDIILGKIPDLTDGANHFFADYGQEVPSWAQESKFTVKFGATKFYKL